MPTPQEVFANPKFQALSPADKIAVLRKVSPEFAKLSPADQQALVAKAAPMGFQQQERSTFAGGAGPRPGSQVPDVTSAGGVVGQFAGGAGETLNPINIVKGLAQAARQSMPTKDLTLENAIRVATGPMGMLARPTVEASGNAAKWYWDALRGRIPYAYEQALTAAPEALGQGAAQALMMRGPIESLARTDPVNALARYARLNPAGELPLRPGPLLGTMVRARAALDQIETAHANVPVNEVPAFKIALRAFQASKRGYTLPKPIADFLDHMQRPGAATQPLDIEAARDFSKSLGERIPWDQPGAKVMNGFMKDMRGALEQETTTALRNHPAAGPQVANQYLKAKLEYGRGSKAIEAGKETGRLVGGYLGYELGRQLGHPLEGASAGGFFGRRLVGPITGGIAKQWVDPSVLAGAISKTAAATSAARRAATPFAAPFTAPFTQQQPKDEGEQ